MKSGRLVVSFPERFRGPGASDEHNKFAADYARGKIRDIVKDPDTAELLCPDQVIGCKRLCRHWVLRYLQQTSRQFGR